MALILFVLAAFSCTHDDNPLPDDTEAPTVTLVGIPDDSVVWNVINLVASATDNMGIDKIEVEVDGLLIGSGTESSLDVRLNTQELSDGVHSITVRAIDEAGNESTTVVHIIVRNILISANIPADIFGNSLPFHGYILLSDEAGKTIAVKEYQAGEPFQIRAPEFEGSQFYLTEVRYIPGLQTVLQTYTGVKRGEWVVTGDNHIYNTNAGDVQLSFTNPLPNTNYIITAANFEITSNGEFPVSLTLYLNNNTSSKLLITRQATRTETNTLYPTHYALLPNNFTAGMSYDIDLSTVTEPTLEQTLDSEFADGFVRIWGLADPNKPQEMHRIVDAYCDNFVLKYTYPGTAFQQYYHQYYYETDDGQYYQNLLDGVPTSLDKLECAIDLAVTNISFTGTLSGENVDACFINLAQGSQRWQIATATGEQDIVLPEVPPMLAGIMVRSYDPNQLNVIAMDFSAFDGYDGLLDFVKDSAYGLEGLATIGGPRVRMYTKYLFWSGGAGRRPSEQGRKILTK